MRSRKESKLGPASEVSSSAFTDVGLIRAISLLTNEIRELYCADEVPWIIGYSGGKDSTAVLQLIWLALSELPLEKRTKIVHVISTDTLVENPVVAAWVQKSLDVLDEASRSMQMPFEANRLTPRVEDSFWVNLIGKGYPAPRHKFRWCTERLKIKPSNAFITNVVRTSGEAILVLGSRKAESQVRARNMAKHEIRRVRDRLSPNSRLPGSLIYTPIEAWTNDDVWMFLMQIPNPWGYSNKDLLTMYAGASADGECPLVVDSTTPSCGDSRFGCWVCTLVEQDKSMAAMIQNDAEKEWMMPLLALRNALDFRNTGPGEEENSDRHLRDFRRMSGAVQIFHDRPIPGPYTQSAREDWLRRLLKAQTWIRSHGPPEVREMELITLNELQEIRRIWVVDKHEMEDNLPRIYAEVIGHPYPGVRLDDNLQIGTEELAELREICGEDRLHYELTRELLSVERQQRASTRRSGIIDLLEKSLGRHFYDDKDDAIATARRRAATRLSDQSPKTDTNETPLFGSI
jgi:DNA sulfur modification protein DndC